MSRSKDHGTPNPETLPSNPVSQVEDYVIEQEWDSDRSNEHELWLELPGNWSSHRLWITFNEETRFLQFNCYLNIKIPERTIPKIAAAICLINERIWLGHFEIWNEEKVPVFRIVIPLRDSTLSSSQIEDTMTTIFNESDRFFPVFQWIIWGGKSPEEAVATALVDTVGEA